MTRSQLTTIDVNEPMDTSSYRANSPHHTLHYDVITIACLMIMTPTASSSASPAFCTHSVKADPSTHLQ